MITEKTKKKMSLARKRYWKKRKAALEAFKAKKPFDDELHVALHEAMAKKYAPEITKEKGVIETVMDYLKGIFS